MIKKIVFIAKTDLNTDGRILNQLKILERELPNTSIDFILLPDKPLTINCGKNVRVHNVKTSFRHNKFLRFFTVLEFLVKSLVLLFKLKPNVLHGQDTAIVQPVLLYRILRGSNFKLIYDDHEIPNENAGLFKRIFNKMEVMLMKRADHVVFANQERMEVLKNRHNLKTSCSYFLNLPYFENDVSSATQNQEVELDEIDKEIAHGTKFIIHQGVLSKERGRKKLADLSKMLPAKVKILLLGGNKKDYISFINEFDLDEAKFYFRGSVNYLILPQYWERGIASIVMYLSTYINNRLCAPNRFYISVQKGLPVIVNKDNPVLSNFIKKYECGFYIEDINSQNLTQLIESKVISNDVFESLKKEQICNFIELYKK